jgi:MerR family copper efflux transcriptional regulator
MNPALKMSIGVLAKQARCTVPTVRYYEEIGLLPAASRSDSGQRNYGPDAMGRLRFLRRCRDFGFSLDQVRGLVGLADEPQRPCAKVRDIASNHLVEVRRKLVELHALKKSLAGFVSSCDSACAGGPAVDCTILDDLSLSSDPAMLTAGPCCA